MVNLKGGYEVGTYFTLFGLKAKCAFKGMWFAACFIVMDVPEEAEGFYWGTAGFTCSSLGGELKFLAPVRALVRELPRRITCGWETGPSNRSTDVPFPDIVLGGALVHYGSLVGHSILLTLGFASLESLLNEKGITTPFLHSTQCASKGRF